MRPLKLTMKAFGSYADETSLDFTKLPQGVYLITGETGSGKTTIFDAIVFALFGTASGTDRDSSMMHSDYVSPGEDTVVTLVYSHMGKTYTVTRSIHFSRLRKGGEGSGGYNPKGSIKAEMTGDGMTALEKAEAVTKKNEEILGLDARQFRQIIMLAQGEFRAFLESDTTGREAILSRLFDDTRYRAFQDVLKAAEDRLIRDRKAHTDEIAAAMRSFDLSGMTDEEKALYDPAYPHLVDTLEGVVHRDQEAQSTAQAAYAKADADLLVALRALDAGKSHNDRLDQLEKAQRKLDELHGREAQMQKLGETLKLCETALHEVFPKEDASRKADAALLKAQTQEKSLEEQERLQEEKTAGLKPDRDRALEKAPERDRLKTKSAGIRETFPKYQEKADLQKDLTEAEKAQKKAAEELAKAKADHEALAQRLKNGKEYLETVRDVEVNLEKARGACRDASERLEKIRALKTDVTSALKMAEEWQKAVRARREADEAAVRAMEGYRRTVEERIASQAGELGAALSRDVEEKGEGVCPVCRAVYTRGAHAHFAEPSLTAPSREDVEKAREAMEACQKALQKADQALEKKGAELQEKKKTAQEKAVQLSIPDEWELLSDTAALEKAEKEQETLLEDLKKKAEEYAATAETKKRSEKFCAELEKNLEDRASAMEKQDGELRELEARVPALRSAMEAIRLDFASLTDARKAADEAEKAAEVIQKEIDRTQEAVQTAEKTLATLRGNLTSAKAQKENCSLDAQACAAALKEALEASFGTLEAYHLALEPAGSDGEAYLRRTRKEISDYEADLHGAEASVKTLTEQVGGERERADMEALEAKRSEAEGAKTQTEKARSDADAALRVHTSILNNVRESRKAISGTDAAYRYLSGLSELATRDRASGGILTFSRYVLTYVFREILSAANEHLDTMSGGKYELVYRRQDRNAAQHGGLNMNVLDHITGEERDVRSLSGGESFEVSMSLALGLSGVVQARSGARNAEAMFIDEGFGSLGERELNAAMDVLSGISGGSKQVGIISHVAKLEECIPAKVRVTSGKRGSTLRIE